MILLPDTEIICKRCGKAARIQAAEGRLCIDCWRLTRAEKRETKTQDNLNHCFSYKGAVKITEKELQIINEVMDMLDEKQKDL